jgi:hypothetical protein
MPPSYLPHHSRAIDQGRSHRHTARYRHDDTNKSQAKVQPKNRPASPKFTIHRPTQNPDIDHVYLSVCRGSISRVIDHHRFSLYSVGVGFHSVSALVHTGRRNKDRPVWAKATRSRTHTIAASINRIIIRNQTRGETGYSNKADGSIRYHDHRPQSSQRRRGRPGVD